MNIHLIAIGGAVMHNLALALKAAGHTVTGSDDEIYDPARTRLAQAGLLPASTGWDTSRIHSGLDTVILGMHARPDNPELAAARSLGLRIQSFPEFIYSHSENKHRVVIAGSHGKTTITSMIMHVLRSVGRDFDYLAGAQVQGFDTMVRLSENAPVILVEGDEYLASPVDPRPKFLLYKPHMVLISGIAWDHINVFPTEAEYVQQFERLIKIVPKAGVIVYQDEDKALRKLVNTHASKEEHYLHPYRTPDYRIRDNRYELRMEGMRQPLELIGRHNMANIAGAWEVCKMLGVDAEEFVRAISTFKGAAKRLEKIHDDGRHVVYKDFAHSPSKVQATVEAVKELYGRKPIVAVLELHTFSSLNKDFLSQYRRTLRSVREKIVFVHRHTLEMKGYPPITAQQIKAAFDDDTIEFADTPEALQQACARHQHSAGAVWLFMSSGTFGGQDLLKLALK